MNKKLLPLVFALLARNRSVGGWITIAAVAVIYLLVQPVLSSKLGLPLPGIFGNGEQRPAMASADGEAASSPESSTQSANTSPVAMGDLVLKPKAPSTTRANARENSSANARTNRDRTIAATNAGTTSTASSSKDGKSGSSSQATDTRSTDTETPPLGKLTEVSPKVFETTAGLRYGPGSVDKHRLLHLMQHAKDRPDKPVHGVFEGDEYQVRALVDEAYLIADLRGPPQAKKSVEGNRTIWKVDMKKRVGYLGGEVGQRKNNPPLTGIQLVLEGQNVITAYPIDPRR